MSFGLALISLEDRQLKLGYRQCPTTQDSVEWRVRCESGPGRDPPIAGLNTLVSNELEEEWILDGFVIHYPEHRIVIQLSKADL